MRRRGLFALGDRRKNLSANVLVAHSVLANAPHSSKPNSLPSLGIGKQFLAPVRAFICVGPEDGLLPLNIEL